MKQRTHGISPKLIAAVVTAVGTYLVTQPLLELPAIAVVVIQAVLVAVAAYFASPGDVRPEPDAA
jgi:energy-converting hydrogenase Eha subunit C